jgi:hypothetical protein
MNLTGLSGQWVGLYQESTSALSEQNAAADHLYLGKDLLYQFFLLQVFLAIGIKAAIRQYYV